MNDEPFSKLWSLHMFSGTLINSLISTLKVAFSSCHDPVQDS